MDADSKNPASAGTLGGANIDCNQVASNRAAPAAQANFAALFLARRYGLSIRLASVIATLADIGAVLS